EITIRQPHLQPVMLSSTRTQVTFRLVRHSQRHWEQRIDRTYRYGAILRPYQVVRLNSGEEDTHSRVRPNKAAAPFPQKSSSIHLDTHVREGQDHVEVLPFKARLPLPSLTQFV